jgi:hypothetical protein
MNGKLYTIDFGKNDRGEYGDLAKSIDVFTITDQLHAPGALPPEDT